MRSIGAVALLLRRVRTELAILGLLFVLFTATSFVFAAAPRAFNQVSDAAIRYAMTTADPVQRDVFLNASGFIGPGDKGGISAIDAYGTQREADFPPSIAALFSAVVPGVSSVGFVVPDSIIAISLRHEAGVTDATRLVSGRWPVDRGVPLEQVKTGEDRYESTTPPTIIEVALSTAQAQAIDVGVGGRLSLKLDNSDTLVPKSAFDLTPTQVEVVGLYEPLNPAAPEWATSNLIAPRLRQGQDGPSGIAVTGYVAAEEYASLEASHLPFRYDWHFKVDPTRLDADQVPSVALDLQRLVLVAAPTDTRYMADLKSAVNVSNVNIGTGLSRVIDAYAAQRARSESVLSIAAVGLLGLAAGATAMLAILLVGRRRTGLTLVRGRGASGRLLVGAQLLEAVLLAGSAALVGLLLAYVAMPARPAPASFILVVIVAATATLILVGATWPAANRPLIQLDRGDQPVAAVPARRLLIEATVVGIAILALVLLRQRGLSIADPQQSASFDPLLAAVPILSGFAAGLIAMRLFPLPVRGLSGLAARRRGFVPAVALRTVARNPGASTLPLLVLMLTAAFGSFASVVASSVERGQVAVSYLQTGADYRLEEVGLGSLPVALDPTSIPGVLAVADGHVDDAADLTTGPNKRATVDLDAIDTLAYSRVTAGTAASPTWPTALTKPPTGDAIGTAANPIPAVMSTRQAPGVANLNVGDKFTVTTGTEPLFFQLAGRLSDFPGHGRGQMFVIAPLDWMRAALPDNSFVPTVEWLRASNDAAEPLAAAVAATSPNVRIVTRQDAYALLHDAPLGSAVANFFTIALVVAVGYMALTLVGAVIMSAGRRTRDLAYMRTLGVSRRQAQALTAVEHAPPVLIALIPGVLLGVAVALLVEPGLRLADFVGAEGIPLSVDWPTLLLVIVCLAAVVLVAVAVGTWLASRARLASALRIDEA